MARKITDEDLANRGVMGLPDVPGLTAIEMQKKLEEIPREVIIPRYNELVDSVADICEEFSKLRKYDVGDYCIYDNVLYKCTTAITTEGDWDSTKWIATSVTKEIASVAKEIASVNSNLTASDNTPFRFGVNGDGEYGYIVTDSAGADTVIPFSNAKKLYQALQYSGLVTEDMTFAEMCDALAAAYPATYSLLMSGWGLSYSAAGLTASGTCSTSAVKMTITNQTTTASTYAYYTSPEFDITAFKELNIIGTSHRAAYNPNTGYNPLLYLVDASGNLTKLFEHSSTTGNSNENISINHDVSALTGKYKLRIDILSYCGGAPSETNVSSNVGAYINLTNALLTA